MTDLLSRGVGFTGTHRGMTRAQRGAVADQLVALLMGVAEEFHHGDCVGADAEAHDLARQAGCEKIVGHPPTEERSRAFCACDVWRPALPYLKRNHAIVLETRMLIAAPGTMEEVLRSGTWATVRGARAEGKLVVLCRPDGSVERITR